MEEEELRKADPANSRWKTEPLHNGEPSVVTWNYKNIRSLGVVIWSQTINTFKQEFPLSYLVQPLERLKYIKDLIQMHLNFEGIGPKK